MTAQFVTEHLLTLQCFLQVFSVAVRWLCGRFPHDILIRPTVYSRK
jgi:hypothetical protein